MSITTSEQQQQPRLNGQSRLLIVLGTFTLLVAAATAITPMLLRPGAEAKARKHAASLATTAAHQLGQRLEDRLALLGRLPDKAAVHAAFPEASRVRDIPPAGLYPDPHGDPPVGYALVNQVKRALNRSEASAEVYRPNGPGAQLNLIAPISDGARLLTLPPAQLNRWFYKGNGAEGLSLHQGNAALVSLGRANGPAASASVPASSWRVTARVAEPRFLLEIPLYWQLALAALAIALLALGARRQRPETDTVTTAAPAAAEAESPQPQAHVTAAKPTQEASAPSAQGLIVDDVPDADDTENAPVTTKVDLPPLEYYTTDDEPAPPAPTDINEPQPETGDDGAIPASIMRAYDIRGIIGETLTTEIVGLLGRAIGSAATERGHDTLVVACDGRHSSPELTQALIEGLVASGRDVIDIGEAPTPVLYFATHMLGTRAGVMVTGSHNPAEYNGLKIVLDGEALCGEVIQELRQRVDEERFSQGEGRVTRRDIIIDYIEAVTGDITLHRPLRVAIDCGNGVAGSVAPVLYRSLGCEVIPLFCEVDGDFPNHHPDPTVPAHLEALIHTVTSEGADLGLAFDGDGDRVVAVDDEGEIIWPDRQLMLFAREVLSRAPGSDIIFDVKCSRHLPELITAHAGVPVMWRSGHSPIKQRRAETDAPLAGEMSGHIVFGDRWYGFDDGLYAGARLLELLALEPDPSSAALFRTLPTAVSTPEIRIDLPEGEPEAIVEGLLARTETLADAARVTTLDGLRVDFANGWGLARASNTQPCLVLRFEGDDEAALSQVQARFREQLAAVAPQLDTPL